MTNVQLYVVLSRCELDILSKSAERRDLMILNPISQVLDHLWENLLDAKEKTEVLRRIGGEENNG